MSPSPDFIIAGGMRCGTTALANALDRHPRIEMSQPKEPNYFATLHGALEFAGPGDQWFADQNTRTWDEYTRLFNAAPGTLTGEASAMYLTLPETAASIAERLPEVKVVLVLRDPLARAASAYSYLVTRGRETAKDFATGLEREPTRRHQGYGPMWWYVAASDYRPGLRAFSAAFPADRLLVLTNEELKQAPAPTVDAILQFLGLDPDPLPIAALDDRVNSAGTPRNRVLTRALYPPDRIRRAARQLAPDAVVEQVRKWRKKSIQPDRTAIASVGSSVRAQFREIGVETEQYLGRSLIAVWPSRGES